jgi:membrane-bound metal-dependent hydrolase YbcI (DUF457 family)
MTQFGHSITGVSCGFFFMPRGLKTWQTLALLFSFAVAANIPDLAIKGWGHENYHISHSLFVNTGILGLFILCLLIARRFSRLEIRYTVLIGLSCAWLSHLLLDSFYNHGLGIEIFWPFSGAALALPIPWLSVRDTTIPYLAMANLKIYLIEVATFVPVLFLGILFRCLCRNRAKKGSYAS